MKLASAAIKNHLESDKTLAPRNSPQSRKPQAKLFYNSACQNITLYWLIYSEV
jgi:hypothetical protein